MYDTYRGEGGLRTLITVVAVLVMITLVVFVLRGSFFLFLVGITVAALVGTKLVLRLFD